MSTGNCHCDDFDIILQYLPLNFMHVGIFVFIFQMGRSMLTFPYLDQKKWKIKFSARASSSLRPDRLPAQRFATLRENSSVWWLGKCWIFLSYPVIIIISLTFYFTCCKILFFWRNVKSVFSSGWGCWCASQPREWAHCRLSWGFAFFVTFNFDSLLFFSFLFTFQTGLPVLHRVSGLHLWLPARWRKSGRGYRKLVRTVFVFFLSNR